MSESKPVKCQKCGKPVGYITVLAKGLLNFQQPMKNVKVVAVCMECSDRTSYSDRNF
jgi:ribosomal protein S14